jgi:hypothetical protein
LHDVSQELRGRQRTLHAAKFTEIAAASALGERAQREVDRHGLARVHEMAGVRHAEELAPSGAGEREAQTVAGLR